MLSLPEGYRVETVYGRMTHPLAREIIRFWLEQKAIGSIDEARRRVTQVVDILRNPKGEIAGLHSVYPGPYRKQQDIYLFYRLYIRPDDRRPGVPRFMTQRVAEILLNRPGVRKGIKGLIVVTENPKLTRQGARRQLNRIGFEYDGRGPKGHDVWRMDFPEHSEVARKIVA